MFEGMLVAVMLDMSLDACWEECQLIRAVLPVFAVSRIDAVFLDHLVTWFSKGEATRATRARSCEYSAEMFVTLC